MGQLIRKHWDFIPEATELMEKIVSRGLSNYFTDGKLQINYNNPGLQCISIELYKIYLEGWKERGEFCKCK